MQFQPDTALSSTAIIAIICVNGFRITVAEMYFIMFHPSFSRLSVLQSRRGARSEAITHYTKNHLDNAKKKSSYHF